MSELDRLRLRYLLALAWASLCFYALPGLLGLVVGSFVGLVLGMRCGWDTAKYIDRRKQETYS